MNPESFRILLDHLQRAAIEDDQWASWSDATVAAFGAVGGTFWVLDSEDIRVDRKHQFFQDIDTEALAAEYASGPYLLDHAFDRALNVAATEIFHDPYVGETRDPAHVEFADWRASWGLSPHHLTASIMLGPTLRAGFSLHWARDHGPTRDREHRAFAALVPHLDDALRLGLHHQEALQTSWWEGLGGNSDEQAMALLDERGLVVRMSPAFEATVRRGAVLTVTRGWLRARDAATDQRLQSYLFRSVAGLQQGMVSLALPPSGRTSARLELTPLARSRRHLIPYDAAVLLRLEVTRVGRSPALPGAVGRGKR